MLTKKYRRIIQGLSLWLLTGSALQALAVDDEFYYRLGGGEPVTRSASNRDTTLELGGAVVWNTDLMCGNFDMSLSVDEQLKGLKGSFSNLMSSVISAATGAVASLPALIIQKVNPALYDLLQNGVLQASEEFHLAQVSCEDIVGIMDDVITHSGWENVAKGGYWAGESASGAELLSTRTSADIEGINAGVIWVEGATKGGRGQPPIELVGDTVKAGYNQLLKRNPANTTSMVSSCADAPICEQWPNPQAMATWVIDVVGEQKIRTCEGCDKISAKPGMGLTHQMAIEQDQIAADLAALVLSGSAPTLAQLEAVSGGPGMLVSRRVVEALREENPHEQDVLINRLAAEMALSRTMERAMIARRALISGMKEPNIANLQIAQDDLAPYIADLEKDIENILFEIEVRDRVASNTAVQLLMRDKVRGTVPIVESPPAGNFEDGASVNP
ncbi:MAG: integrating conjugative element protein [Halioglobus sp.]|nr:integrating conjugative element protein [Halioglobus sp.]